MPDTESAIHLQLDERESGRVATVTVDNEARLNILDTALNLELARVLLSLHQDEDLRVVVLRGAGSRATIGGADIREMAYLTPRTAELFISNLREVCKNIRALAVPVIARIEGYCLGAGLEVAAACDLRVAADNATLGMPEVKVGVPSVIDAALLTQLVGWGKARELVYTGENLSGREAFECGLVDKAVPQAELDAAVSKWVDAIAAAGPQAIRLQKQLIRQWERLPLEEAFRAGVKTFGRAFRTDEPAEYMRRFLDRKKS